MNTPEHIRNTAHTECQQLLNEVNGLMAVVISSGDGFDLASAVSKALDPARIAAMASSIAAIGAVVSQEVQLGKSKSVTVNTEDGFVYITHVELAGTSYILNVVAGQSAILAQVIYQCSEISKRLRSI